MFFQAVSRKLRICHVKYRGTLSLFIDYSFKTAESKGVTPPSIKRIAILHSLFAFVHSKILTNNKISAMGLVNIFININSFFFLLNNYVVISVERFYFFVQTGLHSMPYYKLAKIQTYLSLKIM